jgi:predicted nucleic acid-binding protein
MTFLVDANVLCEPTRPVPSANVLAWLGAHEADLVVDSIVLGEILAGVLTLPSGRKRARLEAWFQELTRTVECVPWDAGVARRWARLVVDLRKKGRSVPLLDGMVAATALEHGFTVATHDVADFEATGVELVDPFVAT